jgi:hypothetical protein
METTHTEGETQASAAASRSFDLDAMGLGPPTKVRRRGKIDKWTRILGVAVVLLLVFNIGVRMGHSSRPKAATPTGGGAGAGTGAGAGAAGGRAGAGAGARGGQGAAASAPQVGADPAKAAATGTVKYVDGNNIYVSQPDGTTKRVVSTESSRYVRTQPSTQRDVQPGDRLVVEGQPQPDGSVTALRVTDYASTLQGS